MKAILSITITIILLFTTSAQIFAQGDSMQCDTESIADSLTEMQELLDTAQASIVANETESAFQELNTLAQHIQTLNAQCNTLAWEGVGSDVLGPLNYEPGVYIIDYAAQVNSSMGVLTISVEPLEGSELLFPIMQTGVGSETIEGRETVRLQGGSYLFEVQAAGLENWQVHIDLPENTTSSTNIDNNSSTQPTDTQVVTEDNTITFNSQIDGVLLANTNAEFYFDGVAGEIVSVGASKSSGTADFMLQLFGPDGNLLFEDDDSNPVGFLDPLIPDIPLPSTGQYRIVVTRCSFCDSASSGTFTLEIINSSNDSDETSVDNILLYNAQIAGVLLANSNTEFFFEGYYR